MTTDRQKMDEIDRNLERFLELLPELLPAHAENYALMRDRQIVGYFPSALDAQIAGNSQFSDQRFSIQQVTNAPEELGRYSYAISSLQT